MFSSDKNNTRAWKKLKTEYNRFKKCARCELKAWCRGCPAVASGAHGDFYDVDPQCWKEINSMTGERLMDGRGGNTSEH